MTTDFDKRMREKAEAHALTRSSPAAFPELPDWLLRAWLSESYLAGATEARAESEREIAELEREVRDLKELEDIDIVLARSKIETFHRQSELLKMAEDALEKMPHDGSDDCDGCTKCEALARIRGGI